MRILTSDLNIRYLTVMSTDINWTGRGGNVSASSYSA